MSICNKATKAQNKEDFTGIIRLSFLEKDWLSYKLENSFITEEQKEVIYFFCRCKRN